MDSVELRAFLCYLRSRLILLITAVSLPQGLPCRGGPGSDTRRRGRWLKKQKRRRRTVNQVLKGKRRPDVLLAHLGRPHPDCTCPVGCEVKEKL